MNHIKRYNESDQYYQKDIQETIDDILDNLHKKKKLSKSEKEFMDEASNGTITKVTLPKKTGNFWSDMSNPHNIGIIYIGKDKIYKQLISVDEEEDNESEKTETSDESFNRKKRRAILKLDEKIPELKPILNELALKMLEWDNYKSITKNKMRSIAKKNLTKDEFYQFNTKLDYCFKELYSLFNQFEPLIDTVKQGEDGYIKIK